ncbi:MAG: carbon starvation protein A [Ruminococcus sp.]|nr:carbon starvation protein A [Ruminococcus sp.]MBR1752944.1 carbon starvation protein A [Ruminococcus sp.]
MVTFIIGLCILTAGAAVYGRICGRVLKPTDRETPARTKYDGVDYVPMKMWKNSLIELLNIAGTGPILGPIQGILFGPIAFITIPIGCVIGGAFHDYMSGMISVRNEGEQMPSLIKRFMGKYVYVIYNVFVCLLLLLLGVVFIYTPGDLFVTQIMEQKSTLANPSVWIVYGVIFAYYIIATLLPIDKIIGRIYPVFGAVLLLSAVGVFAGLFIKGYELDELWTAGASFVNPYGEHFIPIFFVTVACGIVSGFHSTQATLISRTMSDEREGRTTFYNMMILEGFIAMVWAAAAMGAVNAGLATTDMLHDQATSVVGIVAKNMLGSVGGIIAIIGVIVLPVTSGDTSLRSLRLIISDALHIDSAKKRNNLILALIIFSVVAGILIFAKANTSGFNVLWRYFSWANESTAVFAFAMITVYMMKNKMPYIMALLPGMFYMYVVSSYILNAKIGFGLSWAVSYIGAGLLALGYACALTVYGRRTRDKTA